MRLKTLLIVFMAGLFTLSNAQKKVGIIGLDTSHSIAFTKFLNGGEENEDFKDFRIVAAYPYGSKTIKSSYDRIPGYIKQVEELGVEIVPSIAELLEKVDFVLLETNDGNLHLEQAYEVFKAGKPVFIDKPIGANLAQAIAIFELAKQYNVPVFSSSSLRYIQPALDIREGKSGEVFGVDAYTPARLEPSHADLAWYGIHGVEILYTVMGTGCVSVSRISTEGTDLVGGVWSDGRIGTVRGTRTGKSVYGGSAFTSKGVVNLAPYRGYKPLLEEILRFFRTKVAPISAEETLEIFTFIEAADVSKSKGGKSVSMEKVFNKREKDAKKLLKKLK